MNSTQSRLSVSISLVRKELESTLNKAEGYFSQYSEEGGDPQRRLFADEINLARGTFKLLELPGSEMLCAEILTLLSEQKEKQLAQDVVISAVGVALISLTRYVSLLIEQEQDFPVLLAPAINEVRKASGRKPISESHFFRVNLRPKLPASGMADFDLKPAITRLRLMYQVGLLRLLRSSDPVVGLKMIARAAAYVERGLRGTPNWVFWWVCRGALEAMVLERYELTPGRKLIFSRIDSLLKAFIKGDSQAFTSAAANEVMKDLLFVVSLAEGNNKLCNEIKQVFAINGNLSEAALKIERASLKGPDVKVYESLAKAFQEEISIVKESLDLAARGALLPEGYERMQQVMMKVADVLKVIGQTALGMRLRSQQDSITSLKSLPEDQQAGKLAEIADVLLAIELATKKQGLLSNDGPDEGQIIGAGHYAEARIILFDEVATGLSLAKRAISSYAETGDKLHLANVKQTLNGVRGALIFLKEPRACAVVTAALKFINSQMMAADSPVAEAKIEILADVLTGVEYYSETLSGSDQASADILNVAVQGVAQLGYKVA